MGKQVGFFADEVDEAALLDRAGAIGLRVVLEPSRGRKAPRLVDPGEGAGSQRSRTLMLARSALVDRFTLESGAKSLDVTPMTHPVIALSRSPREKNVIRNGRIYFESEEDAETGKLYESLARFLRKWPKADRFRFHIGPHTAEAAEAGDVRLMHLRNELHPA